jgi:hypothetical protein
MSKPTVVHKRGVRADAKTGPVDGTSVGDVKAATRAGKLDSLNEALRAAEAHLYELNVGVAGDVVIRSEAEIGEDAKGHQHHIGEVQTHLVWAKRDGAWALHVDTVFEGDVLSTSRILEASAAARQLAASNLPQLLAVLRTNADAELREIDEAAEAAFKFARGEHDDV